MFTEQFSWKSFGDAFQENTEGCGFCIATNLLQHLYFQAQGTNCSFNFVTDKYSRSLSLDCLSSIHDICLFVS